MSLTLFRNFHLLDPAISDDLAGGYEMLVEGDTVRELSDKPIKALNAAVVDCGKRTLMPGLVDCHVHVTAALTNLGQNAMLPDSYVAYRAADIMHGMLMRGFTTVRDVAGADIGLKMASD
jgi:imidazolonepropionase-like amidohydrolase